jgi:transketolase
MRKAALEAISNLIERDERAVFIGSDLGAGTMEEIRHRFPDRVLIEGIAEQHLIGFAAGLALEGFVPYVHTIATFLTRRALEQIVVDVAIQGLSVKLIGAGGGMVYAPLGPTHQAIDDFALMSSIPEMVIVAPADPNETRAAIEVLHGDGRPSYVRLGKGGEPNILDDLAPLEIGRSRTMVRGSRLAVITTGVMLHECLNAVTALGSDGLSPSLTHFPFVKPLDKEAVRQLASSHNYLVVVEEHIPNGGLASAIADVLIDEGLRTNFRRITLPANYSENYGTQRDHWAMHSMDARGLESKFREVLALTYADS